MTNKPESVTPKSFSDVATVGHALRAGTPVILNLRNADRQLVRRVIDFSSGLAFALDAEMERTADGVYLLTPR